MLPIKDTPKFFLISVYVSSLLYQDVCYIKVFLLKNWKQLFLSKLVPYLLGRSTVFIYSYSSLIYLRGTYKKSIRKKIWIHKNTHQKIFEPTKYPREKMWDPRNTHEEKLLTHEGTMTRWHEAIETYDGTRPTEFSTLVLHTLLSEYLLIEKLRRGFIAYITTYIDR